MSALALSVLLSLVSAVVYAGGAIVQERVAVAEPGAQYAPLRHPVWWFAVVLNGVGAVLHVAALAYGPLSLVQPLGALTIVFALPMAALFVGRRGTATAWRGALMATAGLAGLLSLTGTSDHQSLGGTQRLAVSLITLGCLAALMAAAHAAHRRPAMRSALLAMASGIGFGIASVFTKTVALDWSANASHVMLLATLVMIAVTATAGVLLSQASYRGAGLTAPLSILTVVNPVVAAAVGLTMFGESFRYGTTGTVLALVCGIVAAGGLVVLTVERTGAARPAAVPAGAALPVVAVEGGGGQGSAGAAVQQALVPPQVAQPVPQASQVLQDLARLQREEQLPELRRLPELRPVPDVREVGVREIPGSQDASQPADGSGDGATASQGVPQDAEPHVTELPGLPHQQGRAPRTNGRAAGHVRRTPCGRMRP